MSISYFNQDFKIDNNNLVLERTIPNLKQSIGWYHNIKLKLLNNSWPQHIDYEIYFDDKIVYKCTLNLYDEDDEKLLKFVIKKFSRCCDMNELMHWLRY